MDKNPRHEIPDKTFDRPVIVQQMQNVDNLKEGQPARLECRMTPVGDASLRVQWFHNDKPLELGSRFRSTNDFGLVSLDIGYVFPEDSGVYTCKAFNQNGEAATSATLKVEGYEAIQRETQHPVSWQKIQDLERPIVKEEIEPVVEKQKPVFTSMLQNFEDAPGFFFKFQLKIFIYFFWNE